MRRGISLVETIVVIAVVGIVASVSLLALTSTRAAARDLACKNNLKEQAVAVLNFESAKQHFPSNGWGWKWMPGARSQRFGPSGGFFSQLLPFLEAERFLSLSNSKLAAQPFPLLKCPDRGTALLVPHQADVTYFNMNKPPKLVAVTDYAVNAGPRPFASLDGPNNEESVTQYSWPDRNDFDGITRMCWSTRPTDFANKGQSHVLLLGEKHLPMVMYNGSGKGGYDQSFANGECYDIKRHTAYPPVSDLVNVFYTRLMFGASHAGHLNVAMLDGSTSNISFEVDQSEFLNLGSRNQSF